ncbi:hypothetical protein AAKU55_003917 [Oxalobacteraceae bacterium GrIS 1.11]
MRKLRSARKHDALRNGAARYCTVCAAVVGSAVVGGMMSSNASKNASASASASAASASESQERIAGNQLDFAKQQDADNKVRFAKADALTEQVTNRQLGAMDQNLALAADYDNYNKTTFRPLEQGIVAGAQAYDTPERQESEAGKAAAAVKQNLGQATEANTRNLARMGVNPNSGRSLVTQNETAISGALGVASAENNARKAVETLGSAKKMDAASLGRNLPSAQATSAGLGLTAGNNAVGNTAMTNGSVNSGAATVGGLYSGAGSQFGNAAGNFSNVANAANSAAAASSSAYGQIAGMGLNYAMKNGAAGSAPPVAAMNVETPVAAGNAYWKS